MSKPMNDYDPALVDRPLELPETTHMQRYERMVRQSSHPMFLPCVLEMETAERETGRSWKPEYRWWEPWLGVLFYLVFTSPALVFIIHAIWKA